MILILNGSPNKESRTLKVTNELFDKKTEIVKTLHLYNLDINSCDDCGFCEHTKDCKQKDDMFEVYDLLEKAETLVISSPIYFGCLSDVTMRTINRFQRYFGQKFSLKDNNLPPIKNLVLVSTQGGEDKRMFGGAKETLRILNILFKPEKYIEILIPNTNNKDPMTLHKTHSQIKKAINKLKR